MEPGEQAGLHHVSSREPFTQNSANKGDTPERVPGDPDGAGVFTGHQLGSRQVSPSEWKSLHQSRSARSPRARKVTSDEGASLTRKKLPFCQGRLFPALPSYLAEVCPCRLDG